jgi:uncharacterized Zn finger protein (UPF0148 family)
MSERKTNKMCPECDEEYLVEVREPGVTHPIEVYCPSCGYTAEPDTGQNEEENEEGEAGFEEAEDLDGIEVEEDDYED